MLLIAGLPRPVFLSGGDLSRSISRRIRSASASCIGCSRFSPGHGISQDEHGGETWAGCWWVFLFLFYKWVGVGRDRAAAWVTDKEF